MSPLRCVAPRGLWAAGWAALLAGFLAPPAVAQTVNATVGSAAAPTNDTTLAAGTTTLNNGGVLNLNGIQVPGGLTAVFRGNWFGYDVPGGPEFQNLGRARNLAGLYTTNTTGVPVVTASNVMQINVPSTDLAPFAAQGFNDANDLMARWRGEVNITTGGAYTFGTRSDDGSILYVDGQLVVNNNRYQGMTTRTTEFAPAGANPITLTPGRHRLELYFYEAGGGAGIFMGYSGPDNSNAPLTNGGAETQFTGTPSALIPTTNLFGYQGRVDISGTHNLTVSNAAAATVNITNAHSVVMGTLSLGNDATLNVGAAAGADSALRFLSTTLGTGTKTINATGDVGLGTITGGGTVIKSGTGNLILDAGASPAGVTWEVQNGRLTAAPDLTANNNNLGDGATVRLNGAGATVHFRNHSGDFFYNNPLQVQQSGTAEFATNTPGDNPTNMTLGANGGPAANITLSGGSVLTFAPLAQNAFNVNVPGVISGPGAIAVNGLGNANGRVVLTGANTFTAPAGTPIAITNGTLVGTTAASLGNAANTVLVNNTGALSLTGTYSLAALMTLNGNGPVAGALQVDQVDGTTASAITLTGGITLGSNSRIGIAGGQNSTLVLGGAINLGANTLTFNVGGGATSSITSNGVISGTGGINKTGGGLLALTSGSTFSGPSTLSAGTTELRNPAAGALGTSAVSVQTGATLAVLGQNALGNAAVTLNGGTLRFDAGAATTVTPAGTAMNAGPGSVINVASGTVNMSAVNLTLTAESSTPGLRWGFIAANDNETTPNPGNGNAPNPVTTIERGQSNVVTQNPQTGWADNHTFIYTGQIRANGTALSFAEHIDDNVWINFRGNVILNDNRWDVPVKAASQTGLTAGEWYDVEIRVSHGGGGAGPTGQAAGGAPGWSTTYGFGISDTDTGAQTEGAGVNGNNFFKPGQTGDPIPALNDPLGAGRFRVFAAGASATLAAGTTLRVGQFSGGGDVTLNGVGATLQVETAAAASTLRTLALAGTNPTGTVNVGTTHTLNLTNLNIAAGGTLTKTGAGTMNVNGTTTGTGTGTLAVSGGRVGGTGRIPGGLTLNAGGGVSPGLSVGQLNVVGPSAWNGGATYTFEVAPAAGGASQAQLDTPSNWGVLNDHINGTGALSLAGATNANRFIIDIVPVTSAPAPLSFTIASFAGGVTGFASDKFNFTGTGFTGTPTIALNGNNIVLTFQPVPEPVHLLLLCGGAAAAVRWYRRRKAVIA